MEESQVGFTDPPPAKKSLSKMIWEEGQLKAKAAMASIKSIALGPITQEAWDGLNGKGKWDSVVALRGPDLVGSSNIKWFTTSVIRHRLSGVMRVGGQVNSLLPFVILPSNFTGPRSSRGSFDYSHFLGHIYEAATWLGIPIATVPQEIYAKILLTKNDDYSGLHYYEAEMAFYPYLKDPYKSQLGLILTGRGYTLPEDKPEATSCPE